MSWVQSPAGCNTISRSHRALSEHEARAFYELVCCWRGYVARQCAAHAMKRTAEDLRRAMRGAAARPARGVFWRLRKLSAKFCWLAAASRPSARFCRCCSRMNRPRSASLSRAARLPEPRAETFGESCGSGRRRRSGAGAVTHVGNAERAALAMLREHEGARPVRRVDGANGREHAHPAPSDRLRCVRA